MRSLLRLPKATREDSRQFQRDHGFAWLVRAELLQMKIGCSSPAGSGNTGGAVLVAGVGAVPATPRI